MKTQPAGRNKLAKSMQIPSTICRPNAVQGTDHQGGDRFDERQLKTGRLFQYTVEWEMEK